VVISASGWYFVDSWDPTATRWRLRRAPNLNCCRTCSTPGGGRGGDPSHDGQLTRRSRSIHVRRSLRINFKISTENSNPHIFWWMWFAPAYREINFFSSGSSRSMTNKGDDVTDLQIMEWTESCFSCIGFEGNSPTWCKYLPVWCHESGERNLDDCFSVADALHVRFSGTPNLDKILGN
jgi:hypothetical protein